MIVVSYISKHNTLLRWTSALAWHTYHSPGMELFATPVERRGNFECERRSGSSCGALPSMLSSISSVRASSSSLSSCSRRARALSSSQRCHSRAARSSSFAFTAASRRVEELPAAAEEGCVDSGFGLALECCRRGGLGGRGRGAW